MIKYVPNVLSFSRPFFAALIILLLLQGYLLWAFINVILAGLTDIYDGMLARKYQVHSSLGALLDPIMDKLFVLLLTAFLFFIDYDKSHSPWLIVLLNWWLIMVWVRNSSQLMVVPILGIAKRSFKVQPKPFAKWGTVFNFVVLDALIFFELIQNLHLSDILLKNKEFTKVLNIPLTIILDFIYNYTHFTLLSSFVFRVDVGFSEEGSEATVFFGYPF